MGAVFGAGGAALGHAVDIGPVPKSGSNGNQGEDKRDGFIRNTGVGRDCRQMLSKIISAACGSAKAQRLGLSSNTARSASMASVSD